MTPYEFGILLHYVGHADDCPEMNSGAPAWNPTVQMLLREELLQATSKIEGQFYSLTERGRAFIHAALSTPLPESAWVVRYPAGTQFVENP